MKKRKSRLYRQTLTKIDPSILKPKFTAISQHATGSRGRVTTIVNPVLSPEPTVFDTDLLTFAEKHLRDEDNNDNDVGDNDNDVARGYYADSVWAFHPLLYGLSSLC